MTKEDFKNFIKDKPELINYVRNKKTTWQELYNTYYLYGENKEVWNQYQNNTTKETLTISDILQTLKNLDMKEVQKGITSLQKGIGFLQGIVSEKKETTTTYEPRPLYKYFDD